jgi:tetratricopeptide (TPR) repeat protein
MASLGAALLAGATRAPLLGQQVLQATGRRPAGLAATIATRAAALESGAPAVPPAIAGARAPAESATDAAVRQMQDRLGANPADPMRDAAYAQLGTLYLQKARETGDPTYYVKAEEALQRSLTLAPANAAAVLGMGWLHLARHQFADALEWGERARTLSPFSSAPYGVIGDALIELGRYAEATEAIQAMVDRRPDVTSLARVSYVRELHGDLPGALYAMWQAVTAGNDATESTQWARVQLGHLYFLAGDLDAAEGAYRQALAYLPDYPHGLAGLAKVAAARGRLKEASALYERTLSIAPLPEYAIALGEVYRAAGDASGAARQDALVRAIARLQRAGGVDLDSELILFEVDQAKDGQEIEAALDAARRQYDRRPASIHAAGALAWALYRAGRAEEALPYARQALRLGTNDPVTLFHAGAIAAAAGERPAARDYLAGALARNPRFHPRLAPEARRLLEELR